MVSKLAAALLGAGACALVLAPAVFAQDANPNIIQVAAKSACKTHHGKGWAPTLDMAKFQSWEITAQVTGNWPFMSDTFKNEKYDCKPDGSGYTCRSKIDVCKSA